MECLRNTCPSDGPYVVGKKVLEYLQRYQIDVQDLTYTHTSYTTTEGELKSK